MNNRISSIDLIKIIGLISMIQIHMGMYLTKIQDKILPTYQWMILLGYIAAPLFLFAVGINLTLSMQKRGKKAKNHIIKRSLFLIIAGLLFMLIWQADILHFIGLYLLISVLVLDLSIPKRFLITLVFLFGSLWLLKYIDYMSGWNILAYKLSNFWTIKGLLTNTLVNGFYPMFPWITFTLIGTIIGTYLIKAKKNNLEILFSKAVFMAGILLMLIGLILHKYIWTINFYPALPSYAIFFSGLNLTLFSMAFYILDTNNKYKRFKQIITFLGSVCLSIYLLHVILGLGHFYLTGLFNTLTLTQVLIYIPTLLIVLILICYISKILIGDAPFEYLMKKYT